MRLVEQRFTYEYESREEQENHEDLMIAQGFRLAYSTTGAKQIASTFINNVKPITNDSPAVLHIHAQPSWHEPAFIVGNRLGLSILRDVVDARLRSDVDSVQAEIMTQDGEAYPLHIMMDDSHWQSRLWKLRALPYTDPDASEKRKDAIYPSDFLD